MLNIEKLKAILDEIKPGYLNKCLYIQVQPEDMLDLSNQLLEAGFRWCGSSYKAGSSNIVNAVNIHKENPFPGFVFYGIRFYYYYDSSRSPYKNKNYICLNSKEIFEDETNSFDFSEIFSLINTAEGS